MKKVRIGNDIRLIVNLNVVGVPTVTIDSVRAILINTTVKEEEDRKFKNKMRFVSRYPIEPMFDGYSSTKYNLHASGYPSYRVIPGSFIPTSYHGFGINPTWYDIYKPCKSHKTYEYHAPVTRIAGTGDAINVYFPATAQLFPGKYQLVLVAKINDTGFIGGQRTVTADLPDVFELVTSTEESDKEVVITIGDCPIVVTDNYLKGVNYNQNGNIVYNMINGDNIEFDEWWEEQS